MAAALPFMIGAALRRQLRQIMAAMCLLAIVPMLLYAADVLPQFTENYLSAAEKKFGTRAKQRMREWESMMRVNRNLGDVEKLQVVNDFFNRVPYASDAAIYGVEDYWATPAELLGRNAGDCEDYAIAKYLSLVQMGMSPSKLRIMYVKARMSNGTSIAHMVLAYYAQPNAIPLVLDNLVRIIQLASQRRDLTPVYAFNGDGLWVVKSRNANNPNRVGNSSNMRLWRDMQNRLGKEFR